MRVNRIIFAVTIFSVAIFQCRSTLLTIYRDITFSYKRVARTARPPLIHIQITGLYVAEIRCAPDVLELQKSTRNISSDKQSIS